MRVYIRRYLAFFGAVCIALCALLQIVFKGAIISYISLFSDLIMSNSMRYVSIFISFSCK